MVVIIVIINGFSTRATHLVAKHYSGRIDRLIAICYTDYITLR